MRRSHQHPCSRRHPKWRDYSRKRKRTRNLTVPAGLINTYSPLQARHCLVVFPPYSPLKRVGSGSVPMLYRTEFNE
ncbi:hypothetical protein Trydic_g2782 [Trypoxylus dichotomus]